MDRKWRRRWWKWALAGAGLIVVTFLVVSWMLFQHVPSWYRPMEVPPEQVQYVQQDLARTADALNERMVRATDSFVFEITQDQLNAWMAAREEMWPLAREWLPPRIADPFVTIDEQGIRLAVTFNSGSIQTVLSARFAVDADEESIHLQLLEVRSGSLRVPRSWLQDQLAALDLQRALGEGIGSVDNHNLNIDKIFEGISLPNEGIWRQADLPPRKYRVIGLQLKPESLAITVQPLGYDRSRR